MDDAELTYAQLYADLVAASRVVEQVPADMFDVEQFARDSDRSKSWAGLRLKEMSDSGKLKRTRYGHKYYYGFVK